MPRVVDHADDRLAAGPEADRDAIRRARRGRSWRCRRADRRPTPAAIRRSGASPRATCRPNLLRRGTGDRGRPRGAMSFTIFCEAVSASVTRSARDFSLTENFVAPAFEFGGPAAGGLDRGGEEVGGQMRIAESVIQESIAGDRNRRATPPPSPPSGWRRCRRSARRRGRRARR